MLPREIISALDRADAKLPPKLRRAALAHGAAIVPGLRRLLAEDHMSRKSSGYGEVHALELLRELGAVDAVPDIIEVLRRADAMEIRYSTAIHTLRAFGADTVLEPLLAAEAAEAAEAFDEARAETLCHLGVRDPRILALLLGLLDHTPALAGSLLGTYGDPAALPALCAALDRAEIQPQSLAGSDVLELADAIVRLGGALTPSQLGKLAYEDLKRDELRRLTRGPRPPRVG